MTQAEAARRLGVSQQAVSKWENDPTNLTRKQYLEIEECYGVPPGSAAPLTGAAWMEAMAWRVDHMDVQELEVLEEYTEPLLRTIRRRIKTQRAGRATR